MMSITQSAVNWLCLIGHHKQAEKPQTAHIEDKDMTSSDETVQAGHTKHDQLNHCTTSHGYDTSN